MCRLEEQQNYCRGQSTYELRFYLRHFYLLERGNTAPIQTITNNNKKVRPAGFEPATYGFEVRNSIQLSYGRINKKRDEEEWNP